jgi:glycosyltransferase involved in cell wall biosynthesis
MTVLVSVVVPTFLRPDLLNRCLASLFAQQFDPDRYEVVVADDAASEQTRCLVDAWDRGQYPADCESADCLRIPGSSDRRPRVRYVAVQARHGPAAARNCGWRAATGEIIAFTDDDCIADPGWLRGGLAALSTGAAGAWGRVVVPLSQTPTDYERDAAGLETGEFVTANCFYRRSILEQIGGFDERFEMAWREDSDLYFSLLELGFPLVRAEAAVIFHPVRPAPPGISIRQQRKSQYNALLYKKHPGLYRQRIQRQAPVEYYGMVTGLLMAALGFVFDAPWAFSAGLAAWAWLYGRFLFRRMRGTSQRPAHWFEMVWTSAVIPILSVYWRLRGAARYRVFFF